jgi:putative SOS response-associated peptidase YedK
MSNRSNPDLAIIRAGRAGAREAVLAHLGLIPAWAKDPAIGTRMINARAETVSEKPAFRDAFRLRRCIVPASGFYRRRSRGSPKQLYLIQRKDGAPMGFAGLWELWTDPKTGAEITSCAIITCAPNPLIAELHDRMPVILDPADYDAWLDPTCGGQELLQPCPEEWLEAVPVSSMGQGGATLLQPKGEGSVTQGRLL